MECLESFQIATKGTALFNSSNSVLRTWISSIGGEKYWTMDSTTAVTQSQFSIQGFKNINLFGIDVVGGVKSNSASANSCGVVNSWGFQLYCLADIQQVSGFIKAAPTPNFWNIQSAGDDPRIFNFTNTKSSFRLQNPLTSLKSIGFNNMQAEGFGLETSGQIDLEWDLNFIFYFKYEGE